MVDFVNSSNDNQVNALLSASYANQAENAVQQGAEDAVDEAQQRALLKKLQAKQAQMRQQVHAKETFSRDTHARQRLEDTKTGKFGAQQKLWGDNKEMQAKLTHALRDRFTSDFQKDARSTDPATIAINQSLGQSDVMLGPGVSRQTFNDVHADLMERPSGQKQLDQALGTKIMQDPKGDRTTKQDFLRFAMRAQTSGVQVKMGGDMLGTLSEHGVPGFGQQAAMGMLRRSPDNAQGMENLQSLASTPDVMEMPPMARGYATRSLAHADGKSDVSDGFVTVARDPSFKNLGREQKARLFAVLGEGRPSELRSLTDKTLRALQSNGFPTQQAQVTTFLRSLSNQVTRAKQSEQPSAIDTDAAIHEAKRGSMPEQPKLGSTEGLSEDEARAVRMRNRALVMRFYSKLNDHYDELDGAIKNAKYRQDVTMGVIVKQGEALDTQALQVDPQVRSSYEKQFGELKQALDNRELARPDYLQQVKQIQTRAAGDQNLSLDEKTFVQATASHAEAGVKYLDLAAKKNRKLREIGQNIRPATQVRAEATERRPQGRQARFVRAGPSGVRSLPRAQRTRDAQSTTTQTARPMSRAPGGSGSLGGNMQVRMRNVLDRVDPKLSGAAQRQQISELVTEELTNVIANMVQQMLAQGMPGLADSSSAHAQQQDSAHLSPGAQQRHTTQQEKSARPRTVQGRTSAWGIPQTRERDLGAGHNVVAVRAPKTSDTTASAGQRDQLTLRDARDQRPQTEMRSAQEIYETPWLRMSFTEQNHMKTLGWTGRTWDGRNSPNAAWPSVYTKNFSELKAHQRSSVRALGLTEAAWDESAQALLSYQEHGDESD